MAEDRREYWAAFAIGAAVGIGATLLLSQEESTAKRILYEIEPALERARKGSRRFVKRGIKKAHKTMRRYR